VNGRCDLTLRVYVPFCGTRAPCQNNDTRPIHQMAHRTSVLTPKTVVIIQQRPSLGKLDTGREGEHSLPTAGRYKHPVAGYFDEVVVEC